MFEEFGTEKTRNSKLQMVRGGIFLFTSASVLILQNMQIVSSLGA